MDLQNVQVKSYIKVIGSRSRSLFVSKSIIQPQYEEGDHTWLGRYRIGHLPLISTKKVTGGNLLGGTLPPKIIGDAPTLP